MQVEHEDILPCRDNLSEFLLGARGVSEIVLQSPVVLGGDEFLKARAGCQCVGLCQNRLRQPCFPLEAGCMPLQIPGTLI